QERECETRDPAGRRAARQHNRADLVGDRPEGVTGADHRRKVRLAVDHSGRQLIHGHRFRSPSPAENQLRRNEEREDFSGSFFVFFVSSWLIIILFWASLAATCTTPLI